MAAEIAKEIFSQSNNLQDEVNELKGQVSTLKRRLDALESGKKPHEGWVYSAPDISEEELEEMGYDVDAVEEMDDVLKEMKKTTNNLRWGSCDKIRLGDNIFSQVLKYSDRFLPHWRELCDGICCLKDGDELKCFDISSVELPNQIVVMLLNALRGKKLKIKCISFQSNNFKSEYGMGTTYGVEIASWLLQNSITTEASFYYEGDNFDHECEIRPLMKALTNHKNLKIVSINSFNRIGDEEEASKVGYDMLCSILESNLELVWVTFQSNRLKVPFDASRLIDALEGCSKLQKLDLSNDASTCSIHQRLLHTSLRGGRESRNEVDQNKWGSALSEALDGNQELSVIVGDFNRCYQIGKQRFE